MSRGGVLTLCTCAGLIGWVPNTDTLHALIREYRDARKIPLNVEHRLMLGMAPDYENLTVIQKVEVFEHALESTSGKQAPIPSRPQLWLLGRSWAVMPHSHLDLPQQRCPGLVLGCLRKRPGAGKVDDEAGRRWSSGSDRILLLACRRGPAQGAVAEVAQQRGVAGAAHPLHALLCRHVHGAQPFPHPQILGSARTRCVKLA